MKAVFFDAEGVLYWRERRYRYFGAFLQRRQLPVPALEDLQRLRAEIRQRLPGATREERYDALLTALGVTNLAGLEQGRRVLAREAAAITLFPGVAATLRTLKARGFKLGVITNTATPTAEKKRRLQSRGVDVAWDAFVSSCEVGVAKPHARIYEVALEQCAAAANDSVFIGHEAMELAGARAVGLRTVAFACSADVRADDRIAQFPELLDLAYLRAAMLV